MTKTLEHHSRRGALELSIAPAEMNSLFVHCREKSGFQRRISSLFMEVRRRPEVPSTVSLDVLAFPKYSSIYIMWRIGCTGRASFTSTFEFVNARQFSEVGIALNVLDCEH